MWWDRERPWVVLVPALTAGLLMTLFFIAFDRFSDLENPIASQLGPVCGIAGFLAGLAVQRITRWELVIIPFGIATGVLLWAFFAPHGSPEDREFRTVLFVLGAFLILVATVLNLPQIFRGRAPRLDAEADAA